MSTLVETRRGTTVAITAVPPARAVRRGMTAGAVTFSIGDDGGRGRPWMALFVPVRQAGEDRLEIDLPDAPGGRLLDHIRYRMTVQDETDSPFTYGFVRDDVRGRWLQGRAGTLALLLYPQAEFDLTDDEPGTDDEADGKFWPGVRVEILKVLDSCSRQVLETCRVVLEARELVEIGASLQDEPVPVTRRHARGRAPATDAARASVTFALASCQYPGDFLDRSPELAAPGLEGPADASALRLRRRIDEPPSIGKPQFLILCGDQVYVDATAGLFDPALPDDRYRIAYENYAGSLGMRRLLVALSSVYALLDDHEIADNWAIGDPADLRGAITAYWREQRTAGLPPRDPDDPAVLWAEFKREGIDFFLADTRSRRHPRRAVDFERAKILGDDKDDAQWNALKAFIERTKPKGLAFVVTPSMLLPRHLSLAHDPESALRSDSWEGYPHSFTQLLAFLCDGGHDHVVFLSGDEHVSCHAKATVRCGTRSATLHSVHSSALYAPYPFANSIADDFANRETFRFRLTEHGADYVCDVEACHPPPGDGFALIRVSPDDDGGARIDVRFDQGEAPALQTELSFRPGPAGPG